MAKLAHPELPAEDPRNDTPAERQHKWRVLLIGSAIFAVGVVVAVLRSIG